MEGRREEGWLQRRERCLKCRLDERQRLMFQSQVCVGPEGETENSQNKMLPLCSKAYISVYHALLMSAC